MLCYIAERLQPPSMQPKRKRNSDRDEVKLKFSMNIKLVYNTKILDIDPLIVATQNYHLTDMDFINTKHIGEMYVFSTPKTY